jgi:hypothetical protein
MVLQHVWLVIERTRSGEKVVGAWGIEWNAADWVTRKGKKAGYGTAYEIRKVAISDWVEVLKAP